MATLKYGYGNLEIETFRSTFINIYYIKLRQNALFRRRNCVSQ